MALAYERPKYECEICGSVFEEMDSYAKHKRQEHKHKKGNPNSNPRKLHLRVGDIVEDYKDFWIGKVYFYKRDFPTQRTVRDHLNKKLGVKVVLKQ